MDSGCRLGRKYTYRILRRESRHNMFSLVDWRVTMRGRMLNVNDLMRVRAVLLWLSIWGQLLEEGRGNNK